MKTHVRIFSLCALCALAGSLAPLATAQVPAMDLDTETSMVQHAPPTTGPIVVNWPFKKHGGAANLTVNSDGTYVFSGHSTEKKAGKDFDIALGLKSSTGAIILFHFIGDAASGTQWSKQGQSDILKDDFSLFAGKIDWTAEYHFAESAAGKRAEYEAREKKREELRKAEEDAKRRKDDKLLAEKKAEREKLKEEELAEAQQQAQQHRSGGSSVISTIGDVCSGISSVAGAVGGAVSAIASIF
jgi:hypothetical protein